MIHENQLKVSSIVALGLIGSLFLLPFYMRFEFTGALANINYIFYLSFILLIITSKRTVVNSTDLFLLSILIIQSIFINRYNGVSVITLVYSIVMYFIPLVILIFEVKGDSILGKNLLKYLLKYFNFFVYIIFAIYLIDTVTNFLIMKFLTSTVIPGIANWVPRSATFFTYRYASYMGHYLITAEIYMMFYLLNMSYTTIFNKSLTNPIIVTAIAIIGVLSTGSKTAFVLLLVSLFWFNIKGQNRTRNLVITCAFTVGAYYIGFFDLVFSRFSNELLTTGRNEVWEPLFSSNQLEIQLFSGYGEAINRILVDLVGSRYAAIAKEYTFLILIYKFGVVNIILYLYFIVFKPCWTALKNGNSAIAFSIIMIFIEINMFNAYLVIADAALLYILFIMILKLMNINNKLTTIV